VKSRLTDRFDRALLCAARLHAGDVRKGTTIPYVAHLLGTASIALEHGATEDDAGLLLHLGITGSRISSGNWPDIMRGAESRC
jgi:(p)ppGpp synthase/HD superfamily hydrolase